MAETVVEQRTWVLWEWINIYSWPQPSINPAWLEWSEELEWSDELEWPDKLEWPED